MKNNKLILSILISFLTALIAYAASWEKIPTKQNISLYIDTDSIKYNNQDVTYSIKYKIPNKQEKNVRLKSDCSLDKAAIVNVNYNSDDYQLYELKMLPVKENTPIASAHNYVCEPIREYYGSTINAGYDAGYSTESERLIIQFYTDKVVNKVKANWIRPTLYSNYSGEARLSINRNGRLINAQIYSSSGNAALDTSIIRAIRVSEPFYPLPLEIDRETLYVSLPFKYGADNKYGKY